MRAKREGCAAKKEKVLGRVGINVSRSTPKNARYIFLEFQWQRVDNHADLSDFQTCNRYNIDNTGLF
ncbi:hypothetical protein OROMI_016482 [Orobanche minor]